MWKDIVSVLRIVGYNRAISLEHEDDIMSFDEGVKKGLDALKEVMTLESAGEIFWAKM